MTIRNNCLRFLSFCVVTITFLVMPYTSFAAHLIGGEMTYECNNDGTYNIRLILYRDASSGGANFDSPAGTNGFLGIFDASETFVSQLSLSFPTITTVLNDNFCVSNVPDIVVEQGVYVFNNVPLDPTQKWYVKYSRCCRRSGISNLNQLTENGGFSLLLEIPVSVSITCNNSPTYSSLPPPFQCYDEAFTFDASADDIDGDELVYSFCAPLGSVVNNPAAAQGANVTEFVTLPVTYQAGHNPNNPFNGDGTASLNSNTGEMTLFVEPQPFPTFYTISYCIKEFRNGNLIANHRREFLLTVTDCEVTHLAVVPSDFTQCSSYIVEFENNSIVPIGFNGTYTWNFGDPSTTGDIIVTTSNNPVSWNYINAGNGTYEVTLTVADGIGCQSTASLDVSVFAFTEPAIEATVGCIGETVIFEGSSVTAPGDQVTKYKWDWDANGIINAQGQTVTRVYNVAGSYDVQLFIETEFGCIDSVTETIEVFAVPEPEFSFESICPDAPIDFTNLTSIVTNESMSYQWQFTNGTPATSNVRNPQNILFNSNQINRVKLIATSVNGCSETIERTIHIPDDLTASIASDNNLCTGNTVQIQYEGNAPNGAEYIWNFGTGATVISGQGDGPYTVRYDHTFSNPRLAHVQVMTQYFGCTIFASKQLTIFPNVEPAITGIPQEICEGSAPFLFQTTGNSTPSGIPFTPNPNPSGNGFLLNPADLPPQQYTIYLTHQNIYGCINSTSYTFIVRPQTQLDLTEVDPTFCQDNGDIQINGFPAGGILSGDALFIFNNQTYFYPAFNQSTGIHNITYSYINEFNCPSDTTAVIHVIDPDINLPDRIKTKYGIPVTLNPEVVDYGYSYNLDWIPATDISCTDCLNPTVSPQFSEYYSVLLVNEAGCVDSARVLIDVVIDHGIFVPNAFSPNDDDINDVLYVRGRDILKVKKFSIFTRWGDKIFEVEDVDPNDPQFGWEGKYDGELFNGNSVIYSTEVEFVDGRIGTDSGSVSVLH